MDAKGDFCGAVPKGEVLTLEVLGDCGEVVFSKSVGPFNTNTLLDPIVIPFALARLVKVSGRVMCDGVPNSSSTVVLTQGIIRKAAQRPNEDGTFTIDFISCGTREITITAINHDNLSQSNPATFLINGDINAGVLDGCKSELEAYVYLTVDGKFIPFTSLVDYDISPGRSIAIIASATPSQSEIGNILIQMKPDLTAVPGGTYVLGEVSNVTHRENVSARYDYDLTGLTISTTRSGSSPDRLVGKLGPVDIAVRLTNGEIENRKIELEFAFNIE